MTIKKSLDSAPYFDDYDDTKNYHRILYKPGFAVQARELNQQQTILQNQISRIGRHLFNEGAMLIPGNISYDQDLHFCVLDSGDTTNVGVGSIQELETFWLNKTIQNQLGVKAQVVSIEPADASGYVTLYLKYVSGSLDGTVKIFSRSDDIEVISESGLNSITAKIISDVSLATGTASAATIEPGIYFIKGFAVNVYSQRLILSKNLEKPTLSVGLNVVEEIITGEEDGTLYDNATGSPNQAAPGADRLKYSLILSSVDIGESQSENFIELLRLVDGIVVKKVDRTSFNIIGDELASRTFDESGNYTVDPFIASVEEVIGTNGEEKLQLVLDTGKAFVKGYEIKTLAKTRIDIDPAKDDLQKVNVSVPVEIGNYMRADNLHGLPFIDQYAPCEFYDNLTQTAGDPSGTKIGTARIRNILFDSGAPGTKDGVYRIYLFDVNLNPGKTFDDVMQIYQETPTGVNDQANFTCDVGIEEYKLLGSVIKIVVSGDDITLQGSGTGWKNVDGQRILVNNVLKITNGGDVGYTRVRVTEVNSDNEIVVNKIDGDDLVTTPEGEQISELVYILYSNLYDTANNSLLFQLPDSRIKTIRLESEGDLPVITTSYRVNKRYSGTSDGFGALSISVNSNEVVDSTSQADIIVYDVSNGILLNSWVATPRDGGFDITGLPLNTECIVIYQVLKTQPQEKIKSLSQYTQTVPAGEDKKNIALGKSDESLGKSDVFDIVSITDSGGNDLSKFYELDSGQKDNFYGGAYLNLLQGYSEPNSEITITFRYFNHTTNNNYFSVDSYSSDIEYNDIPKYFSQQTGETYALHDFLDFRPKIVDGVVESFTDLPISNILTSYKFYLPRIDQLYLSTKGEFVLSKGASSIRPTAPDAPSDGMVLYNVGLVANTLSADDIFLEYIENKRYTMRDIGRLEERLDTLEYYTELSLLEKETADLEIKGADGLDRFKNGFIVDPFNDHGVGDVLSRDYKISIDTENGIARPLHYTQNIKLEYNNSPAVSTAKQTNDLLILEYKDYQFLEQGIATSAINVNPYEVFNFLGSIKLTPKSDQWKDIENLPALKTEIDQYATMVANFERQNVLGTVWGEWDTAWTGKVSWDPTKRQVLEKFLRRRSVAKRDRAVAKKAAGGGAKIAPGNGLLLRERTITRTGTQKVGEIRSGTRVTAVPKTITKELGERVVDVSYIPHMRSINIVAEAKSFKPSTRLYPFFDEVKVDDYCCYVGTDSEGLIYPNFYTKALRSSQSGEEYERLKITLYNTEEDYSITSDNSNKLLNKVVNDQNGNSIHIISVIDITDPFSPIVEAVYNNKVDETGITTSSKFDFYFGEKNKEGEKIVRQYTAVQTQTDIKRVPVILTDETGKVNVVLRIPNPSDNLTGSINSNIKFLTGTRQFELSDDVNRNLDFTTTGNSSFFAQGILEQRQKEILSITTAELKRESVTDERTIENTVTSTRVAKKWVDPIAQSFLITEEGGLYLTKIYLYFRTKDQNIPVTLEVRETEVGLPGSYVVPFSEVSVEADNVNTNVVDEDNKLFVNGVEKKQGIISFKKDAQGNFIRDENNQLVPEVGTITGEHVNQNFEPTVFEFSTPIYLKEGVEYAFVVMANSNKYELWRANASTTDPENKIGTEIPVSENPYAGSMFKSQNASTWTPEQSSDVMFRFYRAEFTQNEAIAQFENIDVEMDFLSINPIETAAGTSIVRITHPNHGMSNDDYVVIIGAVDVNGIPLDSVNGVHQISNATLNSYTINIEGLTQEEKDNIVTGFGGGSYIQATKNIPYERIQIMSNSVIPVGTDVIWSLRTLTKQHPYNFSTDSIQQAKYTQDGPFNIIVNDDIVFDTPRQISSPVNFGKSLILTAALKTTKSTLSPIIGTERLSAIAVNSVIDSTNAFGNGSTNVPELDEVVRLDDGTVTFLNLDLDNNKIDFSYTNIETQLVLNLNEIVVGNYIKIDGTLNAGTFLVLNKQYSSNNTNEIQFTIRLVEPVDLNTVLATGSTSATITQYKNFIEEISSENATGSARYVCRKMVLSQPAIGLRISLAASVQKDSEIEVYYKIQSDQSVPFDSIIYEKATVDAAPPPSENDEDFRDYVFTVNNLSSFTTFAVKVVLKGGNPANPPLLKDFRAIALGT